MQAAQGGPAAVGYFFPHLDPAINAMMAYAPLPPPPTPCIQVTGAPPSDGGSSAVFLPHLAPAINAMAYVIAGMLCCAVAAARATQSVGGMGVYEWPLLLLLVHVSGPLSAVRQRGGHSLV